MDAKAYRKALSCKASIHESKAMCEAIAKLCNSMVANEIAPEIIAPLRAVRIVAFSKNDGRIRPRGMGKS